MPGDIKGLEIRAALTGFDQVRQGIRSLEDEFKNLAKIMADLSKNPLFGGVSTGGPGSGPGGQALRTANIFPKMIMDNINAVKNLSNISKSTLQTLADSTTRALRAQRDELSRLSADTEKYQKMRERFISAGTRGGAELGGLKVAQAAAVQSAQADTVAATEAKLNALNEAITPSKGGFLSRLLGGASPTRGLSMTPLGIGIGLAQRVGGMIGQGIEETITNPLSNPIQQQAQAQAFNRQILGQLAGGDLYSMAIMGSTQFRRQAGEALSAAGLIGGGLRAFGRGNAVEAVGNIIKGQGNVEQTNMLMNLMSNFRARNPADEMMFNIVQQTAGMRVGAAKQLQGRQTAAFMTGGTAGLDIGQSFGFAGQLAGQFGVTAGMANMGNALLLERLGISRSGAGGMLGALAGAGAITGGLGAGPAAAQAKKDLEDVFAKAWNRGLRDGNFYEQVGQAVAQAAIGQQGPIGGTRGLAAALMGGLGGGATTFEVGANVRGMQAFDQTQQIPFFRMANIVAAQKALGGGSALQVSALAGANFADLLGGSRTLDALGIGAGARQSVLASRTQTLLSTITGGLGPLGQRLAGSSDIMGTLRGLSGKDKQLLGAAISVAQPQFDQLGAEGFQRVLGEAGVPLGAFSQLPKGALSGDRAAEDTVKTQMQVLFMSFDREVEARNFLIESIKNAANTINDIFLQAPLQGDDPAQGAHRLFPGTRGASTKKIAGTGHHRGKTQFLGIIPE